MSLYFLLLLCFSLLPPSEIRHTRSFYQHKGVNSTRIGYSRARVRRTGIWFPRLVRFADQKILRKVNRQIDEVTNEFGCDDSSKHSDYKVRSRVDLAEKDIFSIYASAEYYCGGPYPTNDSNISMTFDLQTGKQLHFEELFSDYKANKREILRTVFAEQIERSERLVSAGKQKEDSCEGNPGLYSLDNLQDSAFSFNFSREGLKVQPQWPHVVEACAELVTVPYHRLSKFTMPDGLLTRMSK